MFFASRHSGSTVPSSNSSYCFFHKASAKRLGLTCFTARRLRLFAVLSSISDLLCGTYAPARSRPRGFRTVDLASEQRIGRHESPTGPHDGTSHGTQYQPVG